MSTRRMRSFLGGRLFSTSLITRRSRCGRSSWCSRATCEWQEFGFRACEDACKLHMCHLPWKVVRGAQNVKHTCSGLRECFALHLAFWVASSRASVSLGKTGTRQQSYMLGVLEGMVDLEVLAVWEAFGLQEV